MESVYITKSPAETIKLGKKLAVRLRPGDNVLLFGDLGAGKTHFVKGVAKGLGIKKVIKSPTYAYVNRYEILFPLCRLEFDSEFIRLIYKQNRDSSTSVGMTNLYHYDLYRLSAGDNFSSIGLEETMQDPNSINIIEWADRLGDQLPDKFISVHFNGSGIKRDIQIKFVSPKIVPEELIQSFYDKWLTPMHVRDHCRSVTNVAMQIANAYIRKGEIINVNLLYSACMLHDLHRICDFRIIGRDKFEEEIDDNKWEKWMSFREKYQGMHHADVTYKVLYEEGFTDTAELVRLHMSKNIVLEPKSYDTIEKKIIYYADKRVKHREIVDLAERFRDGHERYGKFDPEEGQKFFKKVQKAAFKLEKELFDGLGIGPKDIN